MYQVIVHLLSFILLVQQACCATIEGNIKFPVDATHLEKIQSNIELVEVSANASKIPLKQSTYINSDGEFEFLNIPTGTYLLSVSSIVFNLQPFKTRVDIDEQNNVSAYLVQTATAFDNLNIEVPYPLNFISNPTTPRRNYIKKRKTGILESGPIATVINSPLYLAGITLVLALAVAPYLLQKFDPETARLIQEQKARKNATWFSAATQDGLNLKDADVAKKEPTAKIQLAAETKSSLKNRKKKS
jgi:hypothetical protein